MRSASEKQAPEFPNRKNSFSVACNIDSLGTTNYLYDGANIVEEIDAAGAALAKYVQGQKVDEPLAEVRSGTASYYQVDGLGSITSLTSASAAIAGTYTYDSLGNLSATTGSVTNDLRYTGRESDPETGLYYYRARYYDPQNGRFVSEDPVAFQAGMNFYSYVYDNPVTLIDPTGNAPCLDIGKFVAALDHNALPRYGKGRCGEFVGKALKAGGIDLESSPGHYHNGKDYGAYLLDAGFSEVSSDGYKPQAGDVTVFQPYAGDPNNAGHVQGYDGTNWVSDFIQPYPATAPGGIYPGKGYRANNASYVIYRPTPCPTSQPELGLFERVANWVRSLFQ